MSEDIDFEVPRLYDLPERELEPFDITLFNGIFYHLPEPVGGLRIAADLPERAADGGHCDSRRQRGWRAGRRI